MVAAITADQLLSRIKARAQVPANDGRLTDAEIYSICDDLITTQLGRAVYDADDGRWIKTADDVSITSGTHSYRMPDRAWASGVDQVLLVTSSGDQTPLDYVDRSAIWEWEQGGIWASPRYTIVGDVIRLLPTPTDSSYSLRVRYVRRPSRLVGTSSCAQISSLTSTVITASSVPSAWTSSETIDVVEVNHNVEALEDDVAVTISGSGLTRASGTFTTSGAYGIAASDYACLAGTTCVVQVPDVAIGYLAELATRDVCIALGDREGADMRASTAERARSDMEQAMAERSATRPKVIPSNSPLRLAGQSRRRRRWWGT